MGDGAPRRPLARTQVGQAAVDDADHPRQAGQQRGHGHPAGGAGTEGDGGDDDADGGGQQPGGGDGTLEGGPGDRKSVV